MNGKGGYIPADLLADNQLGFSQKFVYAVMLAGADEYGICRLSARQIADICGTTHAAVQSNRLKLCNLGYVVRIRDTYNYRLLKYAEERHGKR